MNEEVQLWLAEYGLSIAKLRRRRRIPVMYLREAACEVYEMRNSIKPIRYGWLIWETAQLMLENASPTMHSELSKLEYELYWAKRSWLAKLFDSGVYPEGIRGEYIS
jgi:hypothetical protein